MSRKHNRRAKRRPPAAAPAGERVAAAQARPVAALHLALWGGVFLMVLLSVRLVNLWYDVIDSDEGIFLLFASNLLHGNLPYTEMYDVKPPGLFIILAAVFGIFGESLFVARHFATFCLLVAAVAAYSIGARHTTPLIAGLAVAAVFTLGGVTDFQSLTTEHGVIALLMPALWLLVAKRGVLWAVFALGALISCATLTRTNVGYVALALGGYYLWRWWRGKRDKGAAWEIAAYIGGGLTPLAVVCAVYAAAGALDDFVFFNVTLTMEYAYGQTGAWDALLGFGARLYHAIDSGYALAVALCVIAGVGALALGGEKSRSPAAQDTAVLSLVFAALALSILQSGQGHIHYLLQLLPLTAALVALGLGGLHARAGMPRWVAPGLCAPALLLGLIHYGGASAYHLFNRWDSLGHTPLQQAAEFIREDADPRPVYAPTHYLLYWYLRQPSPSKAASTHILGQAVLRRPMTQHGYLPADEPQRVINAVAQDYGYLLFAPGSDYHFRAALQHIRDTRFTRWRQVAAPDSQFALFTGAVAQRFAERRDLPGYEIYKRR